MTKRQREIYEAYLNSHDYDLDDAYGRYSEKKRRAWDNCKSLMFKNEGNNLRVISHNGYMFTAGFLFDDGRKMMYITKGGTEEFEVMT